MGLAWDRGRAAEDLAAAYFEMLGAEIVARNVRLDGVEVDLIVQDGRTRVLVEVRYRTSSDFGGATASIDARKCARLRRAARGSLRQHPGLTRIDVVALMLDAEGVRLQHLRSAVTD